MLITSYTHSAVDNLLLKLIEEGVPCLRVGKPSAVHPGVRAHCINYDGSAETTAAYSELVASAKYAFESNLASPFCLDENPWSCRVRVSSWSSIAFGCLQGCWVNRLVSNTQLVRPGLSSGK